MKQQQPLTKFKVSHILWICTFLPILTLVFCLFTVPENNYTIVGNFQNTPGSTLQQVKALVFRLSFIYLVFPLFMSILAIKWWIDSSKNSSYTNFMTISAGIAIGGWALFASSIDRSTYNQYWASRGQKVAIIFNTISMLLLQKNLRNIKNKVPGFIGEFSLHLKTVLFFAYQIIILIIILGMLQILNQDILQYFEYPLAFTTYIFYWSFVFDLQPKNEEERQMKK